MSKQLCPFQRQVLQRWSSWKQRSENNHCQNEQKKSFQINTLNSMFQLLFYNLIHFTPHFKSYMLKDTCKVTKVKIMKKPVW